MPCRDCEKLQQLIEELHENFAEVPVLNSVLQQLRRELPETSARKQQDYNDVIPILPYSLWPSMVDN